MPGTAEPVAIEDADDPRLDVFSRRDRPLSTRRQRRDDDAPGSFLAEGDLVVERALDAGCRPIAALVAAGRSGPMVERLVAAGADVYTAGADIRRRVLQLGFVQPVIAAFERLPRPSVGAVTAAAHRLVVVEGVDNPSNVGAIVRNAVALGWDAVLLDTTSADPLARRALRVAMGTAFTVGHARTDDLAAVLVELAERGWATVALTPDALADDIGSIEWFERCAVVVGSERAGLSPAVLAACNRWARIPMRRGVDSLNAAAATAIACYALSLVSGAGGSPTGNE